MKRSRLVPILVMLTAPAMACSDVADQTPVGVEVRDSFFSPTLYVALNGEEVMWTWRGSLVHNVTFEDDIGNSTDKSTGTLVRTFTTNGTHRYRCTIHSTTFTTGMVGAIIVP